MAGWLPSISFSAGLVVFVGSAFCTGGCGGSTGAGGPADAAGTHSDGASSQEAGDEGGYASTAPSDGAVPGAADASGEGSVDDAPPSQETGTAEAGMPAQCPAPTEEAGAPATVGAPICTPIEPASPIIATFDGASSTVFAPWGTAPLVGGTYEFPACTPFPPEPSNPLFEDFSMNNWHITGNIGTYSGFGIWWNVESGTVNGFPTYASGVIDASGYSGIQFDISGAPGPLGVITFSPESANQQSPSADPSKPTCGACDPDAGACSVVATYSIAGITSAPKTVQIRWTDLSTTLGQPLDPGKLVSLYWGFPWVSGATPYPIDVTIDNLQFIPASAGDGG